MPRKTLRLIEAINSIGNALTAAKWPERESVATPGKILKSKDDFKELMDSYQEIREMETDLKDCVNELCLKCESYREAHLGACDGCRWKAVKEGFR